MTARRIRVLHIIQNLNYGGMERLLADIVQGVDRAEFESHVLVLEYLGRFAEGLADVATLHQAPRLPSSSMIWPGALVRCIREISPDLVHSHSGVWYKASLAARLAGVPATMHTEHGRQCPDPWQSRLTDSVASRFSDVAVAVSERVAEQLRRSVVRGRCLVAVVLNGVDTERHRPRDGGTRLRAELGLAPAVPIIGSIGRLEYVKGYDYMVEAFARLIKRWPDSNSPALVIAGDGEQRQSLQRRAQVLGVAERVRLLGWRDDIAQLHAAFSLFTMSSRSEGTSVSLLEAMSAGLCPVVTDVGGNAAVLGPALRHRLVPPGDPDALAAAWQDALGHEARRADDARTARARVEAAYSLTRMVREYESLYRTLCDPARRRLPAPAPAADR